MALGLTGCGGEPDLDGRSPTAEPVRDAASGAEIETESAPGLDEPTVVETDAGGSTGLTQPSPPPELSTDSDAGAVAAVAYYWQLVSYARATGDLNGLRELVGPDCGYCAQELTQIEELHAGGTWAVQGDSGMEVIAVIAVPEDASLRAVHYVLAMPAGTVTDGVESTEFEARVYPNFAMVVRWTGSGYQIAGGDPDTTD